MRIIILTFMLIFTFSGSSHAQEQEAEQQVQESEQQEEQASTQEEQFFPNAVSVSPEQANAKNRNTVTNDADSTVIEDKYAGVYQASTIQNISNLYWMKGVLDLENDLAIDNYIMINECDFYRDNIKVDFRWEKARAAARELIKEKLPTFTDKYKIIVPIDLGRYDTEKGGFPLINGTEFKQLQRVEVGGNDHKVCDKNFEIEYYPRNIHLILNRPFSYDFIKVDEHLAQAYILRNNYTRPKRVKEILAKTFDRLAFARVRMSFLEYQGEENRTNKTPVAIMFGTIDGIDVFEYADETGLLSTIDFENK